MSTKQSPSAADKTLIVLQAALQHPRFTDIVNATGLAKSSVHRLLQTLVKYEFIAVSPDGNYYAGPAALSLAATAFERIDISQQTKPYIQQLAREVGCQVHIGARNGKDAVYVAIQETDTPYRIPSRIGDRLPLHSTSIGKCFLADEEDEAIIRYVAEMQLPKHTPRTISTTAELIKEIDTVRDRGFAIDDEENVPGIRCVAVPIRNHLGRVNHALSITTLTLEKSMDEVIALVPQVKQTAAKISRSLGAKES
ncbi:IclR family transcriptional regulator [Actinotignum sp. GS-2025f]|uniref:IclR family transcriptional regulator n=1 Tax=Actinotignum schaalii FB123-CNA-2 TaxID=883067 RepID=S2W331_9ACTO|nr:MULTISPECIES: IclR family transcriptional regulator [Actinotignum]EPD27017.1 hypothetical protein HMPREF9237_00951 [Actinotignum schaalii FB123-CNA-2]MDK6591069.1 IclR family transcriptional regulator [Actinotignum timonense]MDK6628954.1 IclR family transcriptional regulator [Actinotignum timonense]